MSRIKKRNMILGGIVLVLMLCTALFSSLNLNEAGLNAHADTLLSLDSIYTDPSAFQFTAINSTDCSVKLVDKNQIEVDVPKTATIGGVKYTVTEVASSGFASSPALKNVYLPTTIKKIGNTAFQNCVNLEKVYASRVEEIGMAAFAVCRKLSDFIFPETLKTVGSSVFMGSDTKVHARFNAAQSGWSSGWNSGNTVQNHDFNGRDANGNPWLLPLRYKQATQTNSLLRTPSTIQLAANQPRSESINQGDLYIDVNEVAPLSYMEGVFNSVVIAPGITSLNIRSMAFSQITVINGFELNIPVTYNCEWQPDNISVGPFVEIDTPFFTLPAPQKIVEGMFTKTTAAKINFIGESPENEGVVRLPNTVNEIRVSAFEEVNNIKHLYIPKSVTKVGNKAFDGWNNQIIHTPFISELHESNVWGTTWYDEKTSKAKREYVGEFKIVSQPTEIRDTNSHNMILEFKVDKNYYSLNDFKFSQVPNFSLSNALDATLNNEVDEEKQGYWIRRWEYNVKLKSTSAGANYFELELRVHEGNIAAMIESTEKIKVHRFIRTATDFTAANFAAKYIDNTYYDTYLLNNINLGTFAPTSMSGIKSTHYGNFYGNSYLITYNISTSSSAAGGDFLNLGLFNENRGNISNLKINATIAVPAAKLLPFFANVGGVACTNKSGATIKNCEITMNANIFSQTMSAADGIGGIVAINEGKIEDCSVSGTITSTGYPYTNPITSTNHENKAGGIAGFNKTSAEITRCVNKATISGYWVVGGIAGQSEGKIISCTNQATVTLNAKSAITNYGKIGGIVGLANRGECTSSTNSSLVRFGQSDTYGTPSMGQIIGECYQTTTSGNICGGTMNFGNLEDYQKEYAGNREVGYRRG